jgi:cell division protein FtsN
VTAPRQRLSARDYKHGRRAAGGFDIRQYKQFGLGLGVGLAVALLVWLQGQKEVQPEQPVAQVIAATTDVPPPEEPDSAEQLQFYDLAPTFEVVVPAADRGARRNQPTAPITKPGAYVLQTDSFQNRKEAERQRDRLVKLGIDATIQHVIIDEREWHRVIVGPMRELSKLNEIREALRVAQITFRTYQIEE